MKLSYSWLCDYLSVELSPERMSEILTSVGLEVEHIEKKEAVKGNLEGIVIGKVLTCEKHPNADKLKITTVDIGEDSPANIVCGAPNVAAGLTVVVAKVGTMLYPVKGDSFKIKKAKIRGEESFGMICAEDEIGLGESHDGIINITEDVKAGTPAAEYYKLPEAEVVYDIGLTPNRMDAMSHMGAIKDVAAYLSNESKSMVAMDVPEATLPAKTADLPFKIKIEDEEKCPRYQGISIANVTIGPSPEWLQNKLKSIDIQPINNVVDITNFVLQECGSPLHAFDYDKIDAHNIIVRRAKDDEVFLALDEKERKLSNEDLVIANPAGPMCIAGVFGGIDSGVKNDTKNIFLESAFFESVGIRKTAVHYNLRTEAAVRYEKGADISNLNYALKRATQLICELAGGEVASEVMDVYPAEKEKTCIKVSFSKMNALAGKNYDKEQVKRILSSLCFELKNETEDTVEVLVPFAKTDIEFEADVVEEIMRIDGLDNIPFTGNINYQVNAQGKFKADVKRELTASLVGKGFYEIITNSITNSNFYPEDESVVKLMNNLSSELDVMRPAMLETALQSIAHNINRKNEHLKFFEFGKTYANRKGHYIESERLCLYLVGDQSTPHWSRKPQAIDIAYCRGVVAALLPMASFTEKNEIKLGKKNVGAITLVDKKKAKSFDINNKEVWFVDLDWKAVKQAVEQQNKRFSEIPKYPGTNRDLALVLDKEVKYITLEKAVKQVASDKMIGLDVFDVFESEKLGANKKSYAIRLNFLDTTQTITDEVVEAEMKKIISALEKVGAEVRG